MLPLTHVAPPPLSPPVGLRIDPLDRVFVNRDLNLAKIDMAEGKLDAARERLLKLNKENSKSTQPMYELAQLENMAGKPAEAIRWLERLRAADPGHVAGGLLLAELYLHGEQQKKRSSFVHEVHNSRWGAG